MLIAKREGRLKGRPQIDTDEKIWAVCTLWRAGKITAVQAQQRLNMSPSTFLPPSENAWYIRDLFHTCTHYLGLGCYPVLTVLFQTLEV